MTAVQTQSIIRVGLDASNYEAGARKIADANAEMEKSSAALVRAQTAATNAQAAYEKAAAKAATAAERAAKAGDGDVKAADAAAQAVERAAKQKERAAAAAQTLASAQDRAKRAQESLTAAQTGGAESTERVTRTTQASAGAIERMQRSLDSAYRAQKEYEQQLRLIAAAQERGVISAQRQADLQRMASQQLAQSTRALTDHGRALEGTARSSQLTYQQNQILQSGFLNLFQTIAAGGSPMAALVTQGSQMAGAFGGINIVMLAVAAGVAVLVGVVASLAGALIQAGDAQTQIIGRLTALTGSANAARESFEGIYRIALQTGSSVKELSDGFTRFLIAAQNIGATREEVLKLTDTISKFAQVSGAGAQQAAAAAMQIGQALASGKFAGDEFRSANENAPLLMQALAREIGVSTGELRKMAEEGKLITEVIFPAFLRLNKEANEKFAELPLTYSRAVGQLSVAFTGFLGQLDDAIKFSRTLASIISKAASGFDFLRSSIGNGTVDEQIEEVRKRQERFGHNSGDGGGGFLSAVKNAVMNPLSYIHARDNPEALRIRLAKLESQREKEQQEQAREQAEARSTADAAKQTADAAAREKLLRDVDAVAAAQQKAEETRKRIAEARAKGQIDEKERVHLLALVENQLKEALDKSSGAKKHAAELAREQSQAAREQAQALREVTGPTEQATRALLGFFEKFDEAQLSPGRKLLTDYGQAVDTLSAQLKASRAVLASMPAAHKDYADALSVVTKGETALFEAMRRGDDVRKRAAELDAERRRQAYSAVEALEEELRAHEGGAASIEQYNRAKREAELRAKVYQDVLRAETEILGDVAEAQKRATAAAERAITASRQLDAARAAVKELEKFSEENARLADRFTERLGDGIADAFMEGRKNGKSFFDFVSDYGRQILRATISTVFSEVLRGPATQLIGMVRGSLGFGGGGAAGAGGGAAGVGVTGANGGAGFGDLLGIGSLFGGGGSGGGFFGGAMNWAQGSLHSVAPGIFAPSAAQAATGATVTAGNLAMGATPELASAASAAAGGVQGAGGVTLGQLGAGAGAAFSAFNAFQAFRQGNIASGIGNTVGAGASLAMALGFTNPVLLPLAIAAPLIGNLLGGNKVKHPSAGIDLAIQNGLFTTGAASSKHMGTDEIIKYGQQVSGGINAALANAFGANARFNTTNFANTDRVLATGFDKKANKYSVHGFGDVVAFEDPAKAMEELLFRALKNIPIEGISSAMKQILGRSTATSLEALQADIAFGHWYDNVDKMFTERAKVIGPFEQQLKDLAAQMDAAREQAKGFGLAVDAITAAQERGAAAIRAAFLGSMDRQYNQAAGRGFINQGLQTAEAVNAMRQEAVALGVAGDHRYQIAEDATIQSFVRQLDLTQLNSVVAEFGALATATDKLIAEFAVAERDLRRTQVLAALDARGRTAAASIDPRQQRAMRDRQLADTQAAELAATTDVVVRARLQEVQAMERQVLAMARLREEEDQRAGLMERAFNILGRGLEAQLVRLDLQQRRELQQVQATGTENDVVLVSALHAVERARVQQQAAQAAYQTALDQQIAELERQVTIQQQTRDAIYDMAKGFRELSKSLLLDGQLSPLTKSEQLTESRGQFDAAVARAQDTGLSMAERQEAAQQVQSLARARLGLGVEYYGRATEAYASEFGTVRGVLDMLADALPSAEDVAFRQLTMLESQLTILRQQREDIGRIGQAQSQDLVGLKAATDAANAQFAAMAATLGPLLSAAQAEQAANVSAQGAITSSAAFSRPIGLAEGGLVRGGIPGLDSVPAMLMPGELVVPIDRVPAAVAGIRGAANDDAAEALAAVVAELRALRREVAELRSVTAAGSLEVAGAVREGNASAEEAVAVGRREAARPRGAA